MFDPRLTDGRQRVRVDGRGLAAWEVRRAAVWQAFAEAGIAKPDPNTIHTYVIAEGRESGTVGVYDSTGKPRQDLIDVLLAEVPAGRIIFETPTKAQQAWFVERLGAEANLGNVAPDDVIGVETLRRGLRADTVALALSTWTNAWVARELMDRSG